MPGFFNFTVKLPLCWPYGRVGQQLEGLDFSSFFSLPLDFYISAAECPWIFRDFCISPDFLLHRGGGGGNVFTFLIDWI